MKYFAYIVLCSLLHLSAKGQRNYRAASVLATGSWYAIAIKQEGMYRVDVPLLNSLGINTADLSSASIRLFGNGGGMLPEDNRIPRADDLVENAIFVSDGGDGRFNGNDFFLFYAPGPDRWEKDSLQKSFRHQKNRYTDRSIYYISVGGTGLRVAARQATLPANQTVNSFTDRYFHELDSINFLKSGKQWYGEEFTNAPGRSLTRSFSIALPNLIVGNNIRFVSSVASRSVGVGSRFEIAVNGTTVLQQSVPPVSTGTYDLVAFPAEQSAVFPLGQTALTIRYNYVPGSVNAQGWLNWFEIFPKRQLSLAGADPLFFRDWESVAPNAVAEFRIAGGSNATQVWDITEPQRPVAMQGNLSGTEYRFSQPATQLREYVAFNGSGLLRPEVVGAVANQNLHALPPAQYLVVTHPSLLTEANRLAAHHRNASGLFVHVVTTTQIYHEFASGSPDPAAIRDFVKMFYDKAASDSTRRPRYLLLLGDASFDDRDRISGNTNLVPSYQSDESLDPLGTYVSDDFFGFLDDHEFIGRNFPINLLDIGIGRIPARNITDAKAVVDKIIRYSEPESLGAWRNDITLVADDEDNNLHLEDAEFHADVIRRNPLFNITKIYTDAYPQISTSGGSRSPAVNQAINSKIFSGNLIWNYSGHGGSRRLAEEVLLDQDIVQTWSNANRLPLFITATCDFAPFDDPQQFSLGENLLLRERTGAIALMTTTRVVFAFSNRVINNQYFQVALRVDSNGVYPSLGDAVRTTKNETYSFFGDIINNRKFTLLGDPALRLAFPRHRMRLLSINDRSPGIDTLRALNHYTVSGEVIDALGNRRSDFNGHVYPLIFDKPQELKTLGNDAGSRIAPFLATQNVLFRGKARVVNGMFNYSFVVPKDINYRFGNGRFSHYAENGQTDANHAAENIVIGGAGNEQINDRTGPQIRAFLNDEKFVNTGITNCQPVLILKLFDSSGINTVGTGIGHDLTAVLNNDNNQFFVLNDYYEAETNSFQRGQVRFQLPKLPEGNHSLRIKAWDVVNNSSEYTLEFTVVNEEKLKIDRVYNYPNPFTTQTAFWFEHNRPGNTLQVNIRIFTVTGKLVKSIARTINTIGTRSSDITWDGKDEYQQRLGRGVYMYSLEVKDAQGQKQSVFQKLVIL